MVPFQAAGFDPYGSCRPSASVDTDVEGFSDTSKEDVESREGSVTSADTNDTNDSISDIDDRPHAPIKALTLMDLPVEVRLEIYCWLHLMTPVKHAELAPWYPTPKFSACFFRSIGRTLATDKDGAESEADDNAEEASQEDSSLLSPWRPASALPTALLRSNRQIYHEARSIPFHNNEFVFANWFSSGLWAARAFTRNRAAWQQVELRYARLEMQVADFQGVGLREWEALCGHWSRGLWGLRLKVACSRGRGQRREALLKAAAMAGLTMGLDGNLGAKGEVEEDGEAVADEEAARLLGLLLCGGLAKFEALKRLELELDWDEWEDGLKVWMAKEMEGCLAKDGVLGGSVRVMSVKRIMK
jgi:hypothetical protein